AGRSRYAVSGRSRGYPPGTPTETAARLAGAGIRALGQHTDQESRNSADSCEPSRPGKYDGREAVSQRPLLPAECFSHRGASSARALGRHSTARAPFRPAFRPADEQGDRDDPFRNDAGPHPLQLAGEYPRTAEPDRAGGDFVYRYSITSPARRPWYPHHPCSGWWEAPDSGTSRTGAYPGNGERNQVGPLRTKRCGHALGSEPLDPPVPHEKARNRPSVGL